MADGTHHSYNFDSGLDRGGCGISRDGMARLVMIQIINKHWYKFRYAERSKGDRAINRNQFARLTCKKSQLCSDVVCDVVM